jgi:adenylosuccinate synthase
VVGETELALRIVPSGVLHPNVELFIGGGTVVNPVGLIDELDRLAGIGVDVSRVKLSDRAHLVLPYHVRADREAEVARGAGAIGTTGRGIGPAYADKTARAGFLAGELLARQSIERRLQGRLEASELAHILEAAERLRPHLVDGVSFIHERLDGGKRVLIEGAQGSLLDVGFGTYPYVTSSHTIAGGACIGLGIGPTAIGRVIGVVKAYCTRVGAGPLPSELHDERGERLRRQGGEFGTVTGRPRRCGWFDAVAGRYAVALNGLTGAAITKLDVLDGFERVGIVTGYRRNGKPVGFGEAGAPDLELEVEELPGWSEAIGGCRSMSDLPAAARGYVERVEELLGVRVEQVSVGRERRQLVQR